MPQEEEEEGRTVVVHDIVQMKHVEGEMENEPINTICCSQRHFTTSIYIDIETQQ